MSSFSLFRSFLRRVNLSRWDSCEIFIFLMPICSNCCQISTQKLFKRSIVQSPAEKLLSSFSPLVLCRRLWEALAKDFPHRRVSSSRGFQTYRIYWILFEEQGAVLDASISEACRLDTEVRLFSETASSSSWRHCLLCRSRLQWTVLERE